MISSFAVLHRSSPRFATLAALGMLLTMSPVRAQHWVPAPKYVKASAPSGGDGSSWSTAHNNLDDALLNQLHGGEIWVAQGTYTPSNLITGFLITKPLKLYGGFVGNETSINQRPSSGYALTVLEGGFGVTSPPWATHVISIIDLQTVPLVIDGFRIHGGNGIANGGFNGGGIYSHCANLYLANLTVDGNYGRNGGGLYFEGGCPYDIGVPEEEIDPFEDGPPRFLYMKNCRFLGNGADTDGGGMFGKRIYGQTVNVEFRENHCPQRGGGMFLTNMGAGNRLDLTNCAFWGNYVTVNSILAGGGLSVGESSPPTTPPDGGTVQLVNCTFALNYNSNGGHGEALSLSMNSQGTVYNSIFWKNWTQPPGYFEPIAGPVNGADSCIEGPPIGPNTFNVDPLFNNLSTGDLRLSTDSSRCVDAADWDRRPHDDLDVDGDTIVTELIPLDVWLQNRTVNRGQGVAHGGHGTRNFLDIGAHERQSP